MFVFRAICLSDAYVSRQHSFFLKRRKGAQFRDTPKLVDGEVRCCACGGQLWRRLVQYVMWFRTRNPQVPVGCVFLRGAAPFSSTSLKAIRRECRIHFGCPHPCFYTFTLVSLQSRLAGRFVEVARVRTGLAHNVSSTTLRVGRTWSVVEST